MFGSFTEEPKLTVHPGVHAIFHTASPINFNIKTLEDFVGPAVNGNRSILNSAFYAGPQLKASVLTSSIAAITEVTKPDNHNFREADWNDWAYGAAQKSFTPDVAYFCLKVCGRTRIMEMAGR